VKGERFVTLTELGKFMAGKFVEPEEAAQMLGVTIDQLSEMRDRREVYPIRDGGVWKYRRDDIERLAADRAGGGLDELEGEFSVREELPESILMSEVELGESGSSSSTVIGKSVEGMDPESDLRLAAGSSNSIDLGGSDIGIKGSAKPAGTPSDVRLASTSDIAKVSPGLSAKFEEMDALDLDLPTPTDSGVDLTKPPGGSSKKIKAQDVLQEDDEVVLGSDKNIKTGSSKKISGAGINLGAEDDDELVLGGSGKGSDITHRAGDSGIQLISPADSGLSLEEAPMDLGASGIEAIDASDDDMILLEDTDSESATQLKSDDDFLLTPLDDATVDESDSGSQVIALDSEVEFEDSTVGAGGRQPAMAAMLEEDLGGTETSPLVADTGYGQPAFAGGPAFMATPTVVEAPFSIANIVFLSLCGLLLLLCGMMLYDLLRSMWSWQGTYSVNSWLMETITGWFR
jgi:hypothetical protein